MASEDVIELGSSDEEAEPAPKKIKPVPNAMVHIPCKLSGVTIKPAKSNTLPLPKGLQGKPITVTKVMANPYAKNTTTVAKTNGKQILNKQQIFNKQQLLNKHQVLNPFGKKNTMPSISNPMSVSIPNINTVIKNFPNKLIHMAQTVTNKTNSVVKMCGAPKLTRAKCLVTPMQINNSSPLNNLPPSITVTRTSGGPKRVRPTNSTNPPNKKRIRLAPNPSTEVLTVNLDDDEISSSSTASPQWYLKPEDADKSSESDTATKSEEKAIPNKDNTETPKYVEITIEDSPVKPKKKEACAIKADDSITIDDSPMKTNANKQKPASSSDEEKTTNHKTPHSKKKLEYPKETTKYVELKTIEIEIEPIEAAALTVKELEKEDQAVKNIPMSIVVEIDDSPAKIGDSTHTSTPKKSNTACIKSAKMPIYSSQEVNQEVKEFHPVYQNFIDMCFKLENSDDMKKIVEKKIKAYYRQVPKLYTESEEFVDMVSSKIMAMKVSPEKMYLYIKDIVDELNMQRKLAKSQPPKDPKEIEADNFLYGEDSEYDLKRQRQIRKLEKTLKKLHRAIQKLEEQEVDFDDEEDSVYLLTERYKERMVRVHAKFCQLTNTKMPSEPRVHIEARPGRNDGAAKRLEKWVNKKVPIGTPLPFPDFHDVLRCVREANNEGKLGWNEADIMEEARDLFTRCGKKLQRRRQENEWRTAVSRITVDIDPAEESMDLKRKLDENQRVAAKKESELVNKYADRQNQLNLEATEIGDKEAEESPVESDDEDAVEDSASLETKEKRKDRLKRLINEKSKNSEEREISEKSKKSEERVTNERSQNSEERETQSVEIIESASTNEKENVSQNKSVDVTENQESKNKDLEIESKETITTTKGNKTDPENINETIDDKSNTDLKIMEFIDTTDSPKDTDKVQTLSDDSGRLESDIDELHLLQKLHSGNEANTSTLESSDTDTPIAISDTLGSSTENRNPSSDVISIENSSYSESESTKRDTEMSTIHEVEFVTSIVTEDIVNANVEIECSVVGIEKKVAKTNNDEYNESIEDILLASSDEESADNEPSVLKESDTSVNLRDDTISIGDTVIEGDNKSEKSPEANIEVDRVDDQGVAAENENCENENIENEMFEFGNTDSNSVESTDRENIERNEVFSVESSESVEDAAKSADDGVAKLISTHENETSHNNPVEAENVYMQDSRNNNENEVLESYLEEPLDVDMDETVQRPAENVTT